MELRRIRGVLILSLVMVFALSGVGCSQHLGQDGPDAEAKRSWDSPRSTELESSLRNRLATTQRDN